MFRVGRTSAQHAPRAVLGRWALVMVVAALAASCGGPSPVAPPPPTVASGWPDRPNPPLGTMKLWLGPAELVAEVAGTNPQRMTGMMFRTNLAENAGMLFVFPVPHQTAFWMKNTPLPLSAAYLDPDGVILEIHELEPFNTNSVPARSLQIQYVLEVNRGWFGRQGIGPGTAVRTERGTLSETFFGGSDRSRP